MQQPGKYPDPSKQDTRAHKNQHLYERTGDPAHQENNSYLHDDMQGLLSIIATVSGGPIGTFRIPIGSCCKSFCATGLDAGIPEDTPLMQLLTAYSDGSTTEVWFRPPSKAPLGIVPKVKVPTSCECCGGSSSEGGADPDPLAVLGGFFAGNDTLYTTQITGNEFGDIQGIVSPQTGPTTITGFPFTTIPAFIQALQNWFTETPSSVYGSVEASVDEFGFYTITVRSNIEITQLFKTNTLTHDWTTIETLAAQNSSISAAGSIGDFVRIAIDSGNDGSRDFESAWIANTGSIQVSPAPDLVLFDGDKIIIEVSTDGIAVAASREFIIPDTTSLSFDDVSDYSNILLDFAASFDPNQGKEFKVYVLGKLGEKLNEASPITISPAQDSYDNYAVDVASLGISSGVFGIELQASSITFEEIYPYRLFHLTEEVSSTPEGGYDEFYDEAYD